MKKFIPLALALGIANVAWAADFHPPMRGAPDLRVGGGSRAVVMQLAKVNLYAPKTAGLTSKESPVLYWQLSKTISVPVEIKLFAPNSENPVLAISTSSMAAGVHKLNLAEYGIKLQAGGEYRWQISIVWDAAQRTKDSVTTATLQYAAPAASSVASSPSQLIEQGFGYDGIAAISAQIDANPSDSALREERAALLEKMGLVDAAKADRLK